MQNHIDIQITVPNQTRYLALQAAQFDASLMCGGIFVSGNQGTQSGTVDEANLLEIHQQVFRSAFE